MAIMGKAPGAAGPGGIGPGGMGGTPGTPGGGAFNAGNNFGRGMPGAGITPGASPGVGGLAGGAMANSYAKGGSVQSCDYAKGGACLGRTRDFMKEPDPFTGRKGPVKVTSDPGSPQDYGDGKGPQGKDKSMKVVAPRK